MMASYTQQLEAAGSHNNDSLKDIDALKADIQQQRADASQKEVEHADNCNGLNGDHAQTKDNHNTEIG